MRNKNAIIFSAIVIVSLMISPAYAQLGRQTFNIANFSVSAARQTEIDLAETKFSELGLLPDHPLYFLKRFGEDIRLFFANDNEKPLIHLTLAKNRLAEAKKLAEINSTMLKDTLEEFDKELNETEKSSRKGQNTSFLVREKTDILKKSVIILGRMLEKIPDQAKPAIELALNSSVEKSIEMRLKNENKTLSIEKLKQAVMKEIEKNRESLVTTKENKKNKVCIQVITRARNPETGETREFSTPCDVPTDWTRIQEHVSVDISSGSVVADSSHSTIQTIKDSNPAMSSVAAVTKSLSI